MCALLLSLARPLVQSCVKLKTGIWDRDASSGLELQGKNVAILGSTTFCAEVAKRLTAFGVKVLCCQDQFIRSPVQAKIASPPVSSTKTNAAVNNASRTLLRQSSLKSTDSLPPGACLLPVEELWSTADFVCIHMSYDKLRIQFGQETLRKLKRGVRLICCGHLGILQEPDLLDALNTGQLAYLALDLDESTAGRSRKLIEHPNVICTPLLAEATVESQMRLMEALLNQIQLLVQGKIPEDCLNPQVLAE